MANPKKTLAALLPLPLEALPGVEVRPMTLGMWAALERIGSPLLDPKAEPSALDLVPSLYLLTHDPREVLRGDFVDAAMAWADTVPVTALAAIREACDRHVRAVSDVIPEDDPKKAKGRPATAGSQASSTGRPRPTTGRSKTSSGVSRSPRSPSSAARLPSTKTAACRSSRSKKSKK